MRLVEKKYKTAEKSIASHKVQIHIGGIGNMENAMFCYQCEQTLGGKG
ncbi:hypothetical protein [Serpentinicella alkaliphila]